MIKKIYLKEIFFIFYFFNLFPCFEKCLKKIGIIKEDIYPTVCMDGFVFYKILGKDKKYRLRLKKPIINNHEKYIESLGSMLRLSQEINKRDIFEILPTAKNINIYDKFLFFEWYK